MTASDRAAWTKQLGDGPVALCANKYHAQVCTVDGFRFDSRKEARRYEHLKLLVAAGDTVHRGQPMMVVEAMKMEHTIAAPRDGTVAAVHFAPGDLVEEGAELIALAEPDGEPPGR